MKAAVLSRWKASRLRHPFGAQHRVSEFVAEHLVSVRREDVGRCVYVDHGHGGWLLRLAMTVVIER